MTIHDELREVMGLLGKATPGPWAHTKRNDPEAPASIVSWMDGGMAYAVAMCPRFRGDDWHKDADAIVSAVTFLRQHGTALLARQEGEWLPIESAPKDRPVIITNGDAVGEASYHESDGGWWWAGYHPTDAADGYVWQPSHWRPLPAPPAVRSGGGG